MHDPAYKLLFSRPRMVRDLLDGFAARGWSAALDFAPLQLRREDLQSRVAHSLPRRPLALSGPAPRVSGHRRPGDGAAHAALLYQRLDADGVLRDHRALPPVLRRPLQPAAVDGAGRDLVAAGSDLLAPYQPSQRCAFR